MAYRIIQWGTGSVGKHALRTIVERPDYELVGLRVYNPDKVGKDAGELLGREPLGVRATDDVEEILALDADCVCYSALGSTLDDKEGPLDDICRLLASGKNVVSSAVEYHAYFRPDLQLKGAGENAEARLRAACEQGGSTFFHVGINPGFAMDFWPTGLVAGVPAHRQAHRHRDRRHDPLCVYPHGPRRDRLRRAAGSAGAGRHAQRGRVRVRLLHHDADVGRRDRHRARRGPLPP